MARDLYYADDNSEENESVLKSIPLYGWAQTNQEKVKTLLKLMTLLRAELHPGFILPFGAELDSIVESYNQKFVRFNLVANKNHPTSIILRKDGNNEVMFGNHDSREEFETEYEFTHLETWHCAGMSENEICKFYLPPDLFELVKLPLSTSPHSDNGTGCLTSKWRSQ